MPVELPEEIIPASMFSPEVLLLYGAPKIGKTKMLTELNPKSHLILQGDPRGCSMYNCKWLPLNIYTYEDYKDVIKQIEIKGAARIAQGKIGLDSYPYKYISTDTVGAIEDIAMESLTKEHRAYIKSKAADKRTDLEKDFYSDPNARIVDVPYQGHFKLRERVKDMIESMASVCHRHIIIAHVKDKELTDMTSTLVRAKDIDLMGKLSNIVASRVDVIGYVYRDSKGVLMVSFNTTEKSNMGSRFNYLTGKTIPFSWEAIFPDDFGLPIPTN